MYGCATLGIPTPLAKSILIVYTLMYTWFGIYFVQCPISKQYIQDSNMIGGSPNL